MYLHNKNVRETIYNQSRQTITLRVNETIGICPLWLKDTTQSYRSMHPFSYKFGIYGLFGIARQDANSDISLWIIVTTCDKLAFGRLYIDKATCLYPVGRLL
jgi:hypothetical protein